MMLMTKFGKFKLRLIATINLSVLLSLFNIASTTSNYWIKYLDHENAGMSHVAGMWRSCPTVQQGGECVWKNGIVTNGHSLWSTLVRFLVFAGTMANIAVVVFLLLAFYYKINKRSKMAIKFMEWANVTLICAFVGILTGFTMFISNNCNFSVWLHVFAMMLIAFTSNMLTRTFARLYYMNTRGGKCMKSVETACSNTKLELGSPEEKIALATVEKETTSVEEKQQTVENAPATADVVSSSGLTNLEMNKISEANGSNEALLPVTTIQQPSTVNGDSTVIKCENENNS